MNTIFKNEKYTISEAKDDNYNYFIKILVKPVRRGGSIGNDYYANKDLGIENAKNIAQSMIEQYFEKDF